MFTNPASLIDSLPLMAWTCTADGVCDYLSAQWGEFTGIPVSEQLGLGWINALHPDDRGRTRDAWSHAVASNGIHDLEYRIRRHDGVYRWFKTRAVPQFGPGGEIVCWLGTCTDIDDQKMAEERFSGLLASITDAVSIIDRNWRFVFVNQSAAALANLTPREIAGQVLWDVFPEEKGSRFETELRRAFETGQEVRYEFLDDRLNRWFQTEIFPYCENAIVFSRDITARRSLEQQIQQSDKEDSLGVLAGGVAHDFNNLLVGIMGNVSLALDVLPETTPVRGLLEDAVIASERAALLTRQLLAYAGKAQFKIEKIDLSALVRDTRQLVRAKIPSHVDLKLSLDDELPLVKGDSSQIQQVIMNLVINAAESFDAGTAGQVRVCTCAGELTEGLCVSLTVEDEGSGMDQETVNRIFEPFFTTKFTGRGLGLAAVQGIVRSHKGSLRVESTPGQGTTFTITLPACTDGDQ